MASLLTPPAKTASRYSYGETEVISDSSSNNVLDVLAGQSSGFLKMHHIEDGKLLPSPRLLIPCAIAIVNLGAATDHHFFLLLGITSSL